MRVLWLADALRQEGVNVTELPGWQTRGSATFNPRGVVCHHTAASQSGDNPSLGTVTYGRSDLPGPLCHVLLARSGHAFVVASGRANHAGKGGWNGLTGNSSVMGIEAENDGIGEPWPPAQMEAYIRIVAAMCRHIDASPDMVCAHREWTPRKIDPTGIDMNQFRQAVSVRLHGQDPEEFTVDPEAKKRFDEIDRDLSSLSRGLTSIAEKVKSMHAGNYKEPTGDLSWLDARLEKMRDEVVKAVKG